MIPVPAPQDFGDPTFVGVAARPFSDTVGYGHGGLQLRAYGSRAAAVWSATVTPAGILLEREEPSPVVAPVLVPGSAGARRPRVAFDALMNYVCSWLGDDGLHYRWYDSAEGAMVTSTIYGAVAGDVVLDSFADGGQESSDVILIYMLPSGHVFYRVQQERYTVARLWGMAPVGLNGTGTADVPMSMRRVGLCADLRIRAEFKTKTD